MNTNIFMLWVYKIVNRNLVFTNPSVILFPVIGFIVYFIGSSSVYSAQLNLHTNKDQFSVNESVFVELTVDTDANEKLVVVDAIVEYDPLILHLSSIDTESSEFNFNFELTGSVNLPIKRIYQSRGKAQVIVAIPGMRSVQGSSLRVATLEFIPKINSSTTINIAYLGNGSVGDSGVIINDGSGTDVLNRVSGLNLQIGNKNKNKWFGLMDPLLTLCLVLYLLVFRCGRLKVLL